MAPKEYVEFYRQVLEPDQIAIQRMHNAVNQLILGITELDKIVIHADSRKFLSLFLNVSLACDYSIVTDTSVFHNLHLELGLVPKGGEAFFLPKMLGLSKACEILLSAEDITAQEALRLGIVDKVVPLGEFEEAVLRIVRSFAQKPGRSLSGVKRLLNYSKKDLGDYLEFENDELLRIVGSSDFRKKLGEYTASTFWVGQLAKEKNNKTSLWFPIRRTWRFSTGNNLKRCEEEEKMRVRDIMSTNVVAVDEKTPIHDARKIMEAHRIRRLPVMKKQKLVGLVTKHMLLEASPSPATSLSIHELHFLLAKMTVKDIMVRKPYTISPDMPVEQAMQLGQEMGYGAFPVAEDGRLVGIATESDIVRIMTRVLGVREKGRRIDIKASKEFGSLERIMKILDEHKTILLSMMTVPPEEEDEDWLIVLRLKSGDVEPIVKELKPYGFNVTYVG